VAVRKWSVSVEEHLARRVEGIRFSSHRSSGRVRQPVAVLVLDSEALSALARPQADELRHQRVRAALRSAHVRNAAVRVPSAVLVELYRGREYDEPIDAVLTRGFVQVVTTGLRIARIAGHLLARADAGSEMAVDALVVATAVRLGGGMVLTHDPDDLRSLAANHPSVAIARI